MTRPKNGERAWKWLCRGLAVIGFGYLIASYGLEAPFGFYLILIGLFFGPEVIRGQLNLNSRDR